MSKSLSESKFFSVNSPEQDEQERQCLFENIDLLIENTDLICKRKRYSTIPVPGMGCGNSIAGGEKFNLAVLLKLWTETRWHEDSKYYIFASGSGLSGCNTTWWYNAETKTIESGTYIPFLKLCYTGLYYARKKDPYKDNTPTGLLGKREKKSFSEWSKNMGQGAYIVPEKKKPRKIRPLSICELVDRLKSRIL
ncbi:MAG: hypothetical protein IKZ49_01790 [Alphaproteobacteria bacterium]|nr:hypothetical protein [Alphaproteobacteria bacterium]